MLVSSLLSYFPFSIPFQRARSALGRICLHPHAVTSSMYKVDIFNCYISHSAQLSGLRSAAVKADGFIRARLHMPLASPSLSIRELFFSPYTYVIPSSPIIFIFPDIINLIKSKRIIAAARVERMGKIRNSSTYLVE